MFTCGDDDDDDGDDVDVLTAAVLDLVTATGAVVDGVPVVAAPFVVALVDGVVTTDSVDVTAAESTFFKACKMTDASLSSDEDDDDEALVVLLFVVEAAATFTALLTRVWRASAALMELLSCVCCCCFSCSAVVVAVVVVVVVRGGDRELVDEDVMDVLSLMI